MIVASLPHLLDSAVSRIGDLDGRFLGIALVLQLATLGLKAAAWRNVLAAAHPGTRVPLHRITCAYVTGAALNAFAPARGGDVAKVVLARAQITAGHPAGGRRLACRGGGPRRADRLHPRRRALVHGRRPGRAGPVPADRPAGPRGRRRRRSRPRRRRPPVTAARWPAGSSPGCSRASPSCARRGATCSPSSRSRARAGPAASPSSGSCSPLSGSMPAIGTAALVVTLNGVSTAVPVPGGAGTQQVLASFALSGITTAAGGCLLLARAAGRHHRGQHDDRPARGNAPVRHGEATRRAALGAGEHRPRPAALARRLRTARRWCRPRRRRSGTPRALRRSPASACISPQSSTSIPAPV